MYQVKRIKKASDPYVPGYRGKAHAMRYARAPIMRNGRMSWAAMHEAMQDGASFAFRMPASYRRSERTSKRLKWWSRGHRSRAQYHVCEHGHKLHEHIERATNTLYLWID